MAHCWVVGSARDTAVSGISFRGIPTTAPIRNELNSTVTVEAPNSVRPREMQIPFLGQSRGIRGFDAVQDEIETELKLIPEVVARFEDVLSSQLCQMRVLACVE